MNLTARLIFGLLVLQFMSACSSAPVKQPDNDLIDASYTEMTDRFVIMSCVFWDGSCNDRGAYRKYWKENFGFGDAEDEYASKFTGLRKRYFRAVEMSGIFEGNRSETDIVADSFYSSSDETEALEKLTAKISWVNHGLLKQGFDTYGPSLLKISEEKSLMFQVAAKRLNLVLGSEEVRDFTKFIAYFYGVQKSTPFHVRYAWYPRGSFLMVTSNPSLEGIHVAPNLNDDLALHEFVHAISSQQSEKQKQDFTKLFFKECPQADSQRKIEILEEPLAVALGQMLYLNTFRPRRFAAMKQWYPGAWVERFAKEIYPFVKSYYVSHRQMDADFIKEVGQACNSALTH